MSKHTSSPWKLIQEDEDFDEMAIISVPLSDRYSTVEICTLHQPEEQNRINGALICAAPDLLAAALDYIEHVECPSSISREVVTQQFRDAIKKVVQS